MYTIYGLRDPRDFQIRYVGITENHPVWRLAQHCHETEGNTGKAQWIAELRALSTRPDVVVLDHASTRRLAWAAEQFWIGLGIRSGWPLFNQESRPLRKLRWQQRSAEPANGCRTNGVASPAQPSLPNSVDGWYEYVLQQYFPNHPELLTKDELGRGVGVMDLTRWMCSLNGKGQDAMKGTASKIARQIRIDHEVGDPDGLLQNSDPPANVSAMDRAETS